MSVGLRLVGFVLTVSIDAFGWVSRVNGVVSAFILGVCVVCCVLCVVCCVCVCMYVCVYVCMCVCVCVCECVCVMCVFVCVRCGSSGVTVYATWYYTLQGIAFAGWDGLCVWAAPFLADAMLYGRTMYIASKSVELMCIGTPR